MNSLRNVSIPAAVLAVVTALTLPLVVFSLAGCSSSGGYDVGDIYPDGEPASAQIVSGNNQTAVAGTELASPIVGRLVDLKGHTAPNRGVVFVVVSGGGRVSSESAFSDGNGLVQTRWTLGNGAGTQKVEIRSAASATSGVAFATFEATATAGAGVTATAVAGTNGQAARKSTALPAPVSVSVVDLQGNAKAGVIVTFTPCETCGIASPASAVTNAGGIASTHWTLGTSEGKQDLSARPASLPEVHFQATAMRASPTAPANLAGLQGDAQTVEAHASNAQPLRVFVTDALGNGVAGVAVDFTPAAGSAYFAAQTINTGADGIADFSSYFHEAGAVRVEASVAGLPSAFFDLAITASAFDLDGRYDCRIADVPQAPFELAIRANVISEGIYGGSGSFAFHPSADTTRVLEGAFEYGTDGSATGHGTTTGEASPATWTCERR